MSEHELRAWAEDDPTAAVDPIKTAVAALFADRDEWRQAAKDGLYVIRRLSGPPVLTMRGDPEEIKKVLDAADRDIVRIDGHGSETNG